MAFRPYPSGESILTSTQVLAGLGPDGRTGDQPVVGRQRCGSKSSMRLLGHVGNLSITSLR